MKKKLNLYEEPQIAILVLEVQDVITTSFGDANPFAGEEQDLSDFFGQGSDGYTD